MAAGAKNFIFLYLQINYEIFRKEGKFLKALKENEIEVYYLRVIGEKICNFCLNKFN
jgi:hypothetical protein